MTDSHHRQLAIPRFLVRARVLLAAACLLPLTGCAGAGGQRLYATLVPPGSIQMVQVTHVADRAEIVDSPVYSELIAAGIRDAEIRDGSAAIGRVYCCGGPSGGLERESLVFFYVPKNLKVGPRFRRRSLGAATLRRSAASAPQYRSAGSRERRRSAQALSMAAGQSRLVEARDLLRRHEGRRLGAAIGHGRPLDQAIDRRAIVQRPLV